ncbi:hypothetical protein [Pseudoroseicyclus aestuarii]|uniref:Sulfotransferase family protein n=1 Tax=Pseudoroseicyclus aestuarii TaxID=1795041 RepID=A0A318SNG3_9RHOB|nr:hypothetical protein [Pseudoroseicyclus aestuarii]PYE81412.1 hypothetical protein DFP88_10691 [Pseudoroseicyclus aestuarii]
MDLCFHIGANCADGERLVTSLQKDRAALAALGTAVPQPARYRRLLRETLGAIASGQEVPGTARGLALRQILDTREEPQRLVLSDPAFLALPPGIFRGGALYPALERRLAALRALFPQDALHLCLTLRHPAAFVAATFARTRARHLDVFMDGVAPQEIAWSGLAARIRKALPEARLTLWCSEDMPLVWQEVLETVAGAQDAPSGRHDLLAEILPAPALERYSAYVEAHALSAAQRRHVIGVFLGKFAIPKAVKQEIDLPGCCDGTLAAMTQAYEADLARIAQMEGVALIRP